MSKASSRTKYCFSYDSNEKSFDGVVDLGYGNSFHLLACELLLQMTIFEKMVFLTSSTEIRRSISVP